MQYEGREIAPRYTAVGLAASLALIAQVSLAASPQITSFTPASGPLGSQVVITGTALGSPTSVTIDGTTATFVANSATKVTATVPATGSGVIAITTAGGSTSSATAFTVTPSATLSPTSGHPSLQVTVTGAGFGPYTSVDVYFDTTDTALAVSNGLGVVSIPILIPTAAQPGTHWITLDERANHYAAQQHFLVNTNWVMQGYAANGNAVNPFENTLNTSNVSGLDLAWSATSGTGDSTSPFLEFNGNLFVGDRNGGIHAYNATGKLLWEASESDDFSEDSPAASGALVFFAGYNSDSVYAFKATCRSDGGVCAPSWVTNIGTQITAGLTIYEGVLYAPGGDGQVHTLNPVTGVAGTAIPSFTNGEGPVTTPVSFGADGSYYFGLDSTSVAYATTSGVEGTGIGVDQQTGVVSPITMSAGRVYFTTNDGVLYRYLLYGESYWHQPISVPDTDCPYYPAAVAPVVAGNLVFAGDCNAISAFEAGSGAQQWSVATGAVVGLSVANGVLYACIFKSATDSSPLPELSAYDVRYGDLLWTGGGCSAAPLIANGTVYGSLGFLNAHSLPQLSPSAELSRPQAPPELSTLKPDYKLAPQRTPD